MREIEFRAWDKNENKMFYNVEHEYDFYEGCETSFGNILDMTEMFEVMQYTGLKDKNGKKIFEGDIVNNGENENLIVLWSDYYQSFIINEKIGLYGDQSDDRLYACDDIEEYEPFNYKCASYEVIGNIYENPELLEGRK